jgi:tetratricopeptide (TPR) repeat protein
MGGTPVRRGILALDIEGFGHTGRTDPLRAQLRARLHALLDHALHAAKIPPAQLAARSDLGDGILVLFDPHVPTATLLHPLLSTLTTQLAADHQQASGPGRLRLRVAVHDGHVLHDAHGYTGEDLNHCFRLLDAHATRTVLADNRDAAAVLVVSDAVYQGVVRHAYPGLDPAGWQPVRVHAKETRTRAWVHLPGLPHQPVLSSVLTVPPLGPATLPIPRELPSLPEAFTGRTTELAQLERLLKVTAGAVGGPVVISAIDGMGGIGKSALAIQAAHQLAGRYPDGQLHLDLHGATPGHPPTTPLAALQRMLRSLGMDPAAIPMEVDEASARLRSVAADQRLLLVLDNAATSEQVRPLLPASPTCGVLVTSRRVLATLDGARPLHLDVLPPAEAVELLGKLAGPERVSANPEAAAAVVGWCGWLPLAIRIAGARLKARPTWPVGELARLLSDAIRRLSELTADGVGVRAAFEVSLHALQHSTDPIDPAAARAFGLLSLPDGPDLDVAGAARLLDQAESTAQTLVERLVDAQLLESPRPGRYQFHDLVRLYARQHATSTHPEPERLAALQRLFGFYTATAWHTLGLLRPGDRRLATADPTWTSGGLQFADARAALGWLEAERANLLAAIGQTATLAPAIPARLATDLTRALYGFLDVRNHWADQVQANQTALALAQRTGDRPGQAHPHNDLGFVSMRLGRYPEALAHHQQALTLFRELGDRHGHAGSLANLGIVYERLGRYPEALAHQQQALALRRELGDRWGQAISLSNLGVVYERLGRYPEALAHQQQALARFRELGNRRGQAEALRDLGDALLGLGRHQQAREAWQEALGLCEALQIPEGDEVRTRLAALPAETAAADREPRDTAGPHAATG